MSRKILDPSIRAGRRAAPLFALAIAMLMHPQSAQAEEVMFELETNNFLGVGSGSSQGPEIELFPNGTEFVVDVDPTASPNEFMLTFNNVWLPSVELALDSIRWEFTLIPNDFTLHYNATNGGINMPIDGADAVQLEIKAVNTNTNSVTDTDLIWIDFTTDPGLTHGCPPFPSQPAEGQAYSTISDEIVLVASSCLPMGAAFTTFWWKLGGQIPLPAPEPGAGLAGVASLVALGGMRRRRSRES